MPQFKLSQASLDKLKGVDKRLQDIVKKAITLSEVDFFVIEGVRTLERQKILVATGKSKTLKSKHIEGHAVDLAPVPPKGKDVEWGNTKKFEAICKAMMQAAKELGYSVEWGGSWKSFVDCPHYQINYTDFVKGE